MPHPLAYAEHLRTWTEQAFASDATARLDLWDTGRTDPRGCSILRYALAIIPDPPSDTSRAVVIFDGDDYSPGPMIAIDSDECAEGLLSFFSAYGESIRYSGDNADVPSFTPEQREALARYDEEISMWGFTLCPNP